jgi:hypothetical protein
MIPTNDWPHFGDLQAADKTNKNKPEWIILFPFRL